MSDPVDATDERSLVQTGRGRSAEAEDDLRLDARFGQAFERNFERLGGEIADRAVVDIAPNRRIDAIFSPDGPVGEADLAADRTLSTRFSLGPYGAGDPVGLLESEIGIDPGERRDLAPGLEDRENLPGDRLDIHGELVLVAARVLDIINARNAAPRRHWR
jgi:hypothetical protein